MSSGEVEELVKEILIKHEKAGLTIDDVYRYFEECRDVSERALPVEKAGNIGCLAMI